MSAITSHLGVAAVLAMLYLSMLFANLSRRLSAVAKKTYRQVWFTVASFLIGMAAAGQIVRAGANLAPDKAYPWLLQPWFGLVFYYVPLLAGVALFLALVIHYWGWIIHEDLGG